MAALEEINDNNFDTLVLNSDKPVLVDFCAPWCGPCRKLSPVIEQLQNEFSQVFKFYKINADKNTQKAKEYGVLSLPCILIFKDGVLKETMAGMVPKSAIVTNIKKFLQ